MKRRVSILLLAVFIPLMSGCVDTREESFESTLRAYEQLVRWGKIEKVNQFRKKPLVFSQVDKQRFKNIKVTGYEILGIEMQNETSGAVTVEISYYHEQYAREKSVEDKQQWQFDKTGERWFISSLLPTF